MSTKTRPSGICVTCRHGESCMYATDPKRPVLQCEEFECHESSAPAGAATREKRRRNPSEDAAASAGLKGLCVNCDIRDHCDYPRPEGGVWHCEEYV